MASFPIQFHANMPQKSTEDAPSTGPVPPLEGMEGVPFLVKKISHTELEMNWNRTERSPSSWLQPRTTLVAVVIWEMKHWMEYLFVFLSFSLSVYPSLCNFAFQLCNKYFVKIQIILFLEQLYSI